MDALTAEGYRRAFDQLRREATDAELCGNEGLAHTLRVEASNCLLLAADIERAERGLPPLPPTGLS